MYYSQDEVRFERDAHMLSTQTVDDLTARLTTAEESVRQFESEIERFTEAAQNDQAAKQQLEEQLESMNELVQQAQQHAAENEGQRIELVQTHTEEVEALRIALAEAQNAQAQVCGEVVKEVSFS
jgi:predicted GNAT family acetyltransferase